MKIGRCQATSPFLLECIPEEYHFSNPIQGRRPQCGGGGARVRPLAARVSFAPKIYALPPRKSHTVNDENDVTARVKRDDPVFVAQPIV